MTAGARLFEDLMRFKPYGLTANGWAVKAGVSRTIWSDLRRHGNPSRRTLEKLLAAAGSSLAEFEALRIGEQAPQFAEAMPGVTDSRPAAWRAAPLPPAPLLAARNCGEWGEAGSGIELAELLIESVRGEVARPASMAGDHDAYALAMPGNAMWPRFRQGRHLLVSPAAPISDGDDVVVRLGSGSPRARAVEVLIKEMVRQTGEFVELRQFNPDLTFRVEAADVVALHKIIGEAI